MDPRPPVPGQTPEPAGKRSNTLLTVLLVAGAVFALIHAVVSALTIGTVAWGISSCTRAFSDDPVRDTKETAAFIANLKVTERDLEVFDALYAEFENLSQDLSEYDEGYVLTVDELRAYLEQGSWPTDPAGYGGTDSSRSPQIWVRIAELSEDAIEAETGEDWHVIDFSYPFPNNGPIPVPAKRESGDCTVTRLVCVEGEDEGLISYVNYYRWDNPAKFEVNIQSTRQQHRERIAFCKIIEALGFIGAREYATDGYDLFIWATGEDDELLDMDTFLRCANEFADAAGDYKHIHILAPDAPLSLLYNTLSTHSNEKPPLVVDGAEAHEILMLTGYTYSVRVAESDELLEAYRSSGDERIEADDVRGALAPDPSEYERYSWHAPDDGAEFDEGIAHLAAGALGIDAQDVIATVEYEEDAHESEEDVVLILPQGSVPETYKGYAAAEQSLIDALWNDLEIDPSKRTALFVHIYVAEQDGIRDETGASVPFEEVRAVAAENRPADLARFEVTLALSSMPSAFQWPDSERNVYLSEPFDIGGSIPESRTWFLEQYDTSGKLG